MIRKIEWGCKNGQFIKVSIEVRYAPLNDKAVNKALMIAMNYLTENMETEVEESAE